MKLKVQHRLSVAVLISREVQLSLTNDKLNSDKHACLTFNLKDLTMVVNCSFILVIKPYERVLLPRASLRGRERWYSNTMEGRGGRCFQGLANEQSLACAGLI